LCIFLFKPFRNRLASQGEWLTTSGAANFWELLGYGKHRNNGAISKYSYQTIINYNSI
jgi:hypothetical protein